MVFRHAFAALHVIAPGRVRVHNAIFSGLRHQRACSLLAGAGFVGCVLTFPAFSFRVPVREGFSAAPFVASRVACKFSIAWPYPSIRASLSCLRKSAVTGQQTSLHFPCLSWVEGMLTYSPFSPEQMRKPSILKQSPIVTLAKAKKVPHRGNRTHGYIQLQAFGHLGLRLHGFSVGFTRIMKVPPC